MKKDNSNIDIKTIARLSKLKLTDIEAEALKEDLNEIIFFANSIDSFSLSKETGDDVFFNKTEHYSNLRSDNICTSFERETLLENSASRTAEYIRVPKVIK